MTPARPAVSCGFHVTLVGARSLKCTLLHALGKVTYGAHLSPWPTRGWSTEPCQSDQRSFIRHVLLLKIRCQQVKRLPQIPCESDVFCRTGHLHLILNIHSVGWLHQQCPAGVPSFVSNRLDRIWSETLRKCLQHRRKRRLVVLGLVSTHFWSVKINDFLGARFAYLLGDLRTYLPVYAPRAPCHSWPGKGP